MASVRLNGDTSGFIEISAPNVAGSTTITLPATSGGDFLVTDNNGDLNVDSGTLFVDASTDRVGIGTTSPGDKLAVSNGTNITELSGYSVYFKTDSTGYILAGPSGGSSGRLVFSTNAVERARIDSSGRLLVGLSSARTDFATTPQLQVEGTDSATSSFSLTRNSNDTGRPTFFFGKSRGSSDGATNVVANGDGLGTIEWAGGDGDQLVRAAYIAGFVDGTPGNNDMPGRLSFWTTADGASSPTERLKINKSGVLYSVPTYTTTTSTAANVNVRSDGALLRSTSSIKYKTSVETLQDGYADALLDCRPVWYKSTSQSDNPAHSFWGFIAEEVAEIDPRLVHWKTTEPVVQEDGSLEHVPCEPEPEGVAYDRFVPHLLNLIKRQKEQLETQAASIASLEARLTALEGGN